MEKALSSPGQEEEGEEGKVEEEEGLRPETDRKEKRAQLLGV